MAVREARLSKANKKLCLFGFGRCCAFTVVSFPDCLFQTNTSHECSDPAQDSLENANNSQGELLPSVEPHAGHACFHVIAVWVGSLIPFCTWVNSLGRLTRLLRASQLAQGSPGSAQVILPPREDMPKTGPSPWLGIWVGRPGSGLCDSEREMQGGGWNLHRVPRRTVWDGQWLAFM